MPYRRVLATLILLISVLFMPYWVTLPLAIIFMFYFRRYIEAVALFLVSDLLFGVKDSELWGIYLFSFILSILLLAVVEFLKKKLKFYPAHREF